MEARVADMSVEDLRVLIQEAVTQVLVDLLSNPDEHLELREDFQDALKLSLAREKSDGENIPAESLAAELGLSW